MWFMWHDEWFCYVEIIIDYKVDKQTKEIIESLGVTDYEMEEAIKKERMYGVWDRETNNY